MVQNSEKTFSLIPRDHSHEQTTELCKGSSGLTNFSDMPDTKEEHGTALNENLQTHAAFEDAADIGFTAQHRGHHEEGSSLQMGFADEVRSIISVLRTNNLFLPQNGHAPYTKGHAICNHGGALQCIRMRQGSPRSLRY